MTDQKQWSLDDPDFQKIMGETALIPWEQLLPLFASGKVIFADRSLDLVKVAYCLMNDDKTQFEQWIDSSLVHPVNDQQAKAWLENNVEVWAVVVKPWVLVQEQKPADNQ